MRLTEIMNARQLWLKSSLVVACCAVAAPALPLLNDAPVKRLYIEAFTTKTGAEKLRADLSSELRRLSSVSLVSDESKADLILGGGGEIWIRGYRSFSPRSKLKLSSNGIPIYGGYLAVELRNREGITLWSDLVAPKAASEDALNDVVKQIAQHLTEAVVRAEAPAKRAPAASAPVKVHAAGATFPYPVYSKWFANYRIENPASEISYDAIGSEAGVRKLLSGEVDFAASDSSDGIREIAPSEESKYLFFPTVIGAVVPIVNLPGVSSDIAFTPEALAGIFLGKITKWDDPILQRANRGVHLPNLDIVVVHRSDGSGTSSTWTDYLSKTSPEWKAQVGARLSPKWPCGRGAEGNDGVAKLVKELGGSIGYVEYIYALQNHLSYGKVRNRNSEFVGASLESIASAIGHSPEVGDDFKTSIVDAPGENAYPIASFTWLVVPAHVAEDAKRSAITAFLNWMLGPGQRQAAALGYLALPREIVTREEEAIARIH